MLCSLLLKISHVYGVIDRW